MHWLRRLIVLSVPCFLCLLQWGCLGPLPSGPPREVWAKSFGITKEGVVHTVLVDKQGNVFIMGVFEGELQAGTGTLSAQNQPETFFGKLDSEGNWLWIKTNANTLFRGMALDSQEHLIVTGSYQKEATFGSDTLKADADPAIGVFAAKLDSEGKWEWARSVDVGFHIGASSMTLDKDDNVFLLSTIANDARLVSGQGTDSLKEGEFRDVSMVRLDSTGKHVWIKRLGFTNVVCGVRSVASHNGNFFITYTLLSNLLFGQNGPIKDGKDTFVVEKFSDTGESIWTKKFESTEGSSSGSITIDSQGSVYVSGRFSGDIQVGAESMSIAQDQQDSFIAKMDNDGHLQWTKRAVYSTNPPSIPPGPFQGRFTDLATIKAVRRDHILVTGSFRGQATLGEYRLGDERAPTTTPQHLTAMLDREGNWLWAKALESYVAPNIGLDMSMDHQDNLYVVGLFFSLFPFQDKTKYLVSKGRYDGFLMKMSWNL